MYLHYVIKSVPGVSEKEAWRVDKPVKVGVAVEVGHSGLPGLPDRGHHLVRLVGRHQWYSHCWLAPLKVGD